MPITSITYTNTQAHRHHILDTLRARRAQNPHYSVLDIGGYWTGWSAPVTDLLVDLQANPASDAQGVPRILCLDICSEASWDILREHIRTHRQGRLFDYVICTHTLEDVPLPQLALHSLPTVALSGVISMPCLRDELSARAESAQAHWLGYIHHRWIFDQARDAAGNMIMTLTPKLSLLEALCRIEHDHAPDERSQSIVYAWCRDIPHDASLLSGDQTFSLTQRYRAFIRAYTDHLGPLPVTGQQLRV